MKSFSKKQLKSLYQIITASLLFSVGMVLEILEISYIPLVFFALAYLIVGAKVLFDAVHGLFSARLLEEDFLMAIATVGAFILGEYSEGVAVMLFFRIGELFESVAVSRSRRSIASLMELRADIAHVKRDGETADVSPEEVEVGETIVVRPGEKLPLDGIITEGETSLNTAALTGESLPRGVSVGDEVMSGCVNMDGLIHLRVTRPFGESTVSRILDLVENSAAKKSKKEAFITRFARVYTPAVVIAAVLISVIPSLFTGEWGKWVYQGLNFLVISCPCALVISVPMAFFGGIGAASRRGVLVKGGNYLEALAEVDTVIFDKTGTLTEGRFSVTEVCPVNVSREELLAIAAKAESAATHPIARSIMEVSGEVETEGVTDIHESAGMGVTCKIDGARVSVGSARLMESLGVAFVPADTAGTVVYAARDGEYLGHIIISDKIKPTAKAAVDALRASGVKRCIMLTGDREVTARSVADALSLDMYRAELLPGDKVTEVEKLLGDGKCAFVGDGINDAPVLTRADVGVAMGGIGSDAAIEAADAVLMDDDLSKLASAISTARKTVRISKQNIVLALGVKGAIMLLGIFGIANMWLAVFADVGVAMLAILNSMRVMR